MFKNQHYAWLHSVYKCSYCLQSNLIFFSSFPGQNPNRKEKPGIKQGFPRQMMPSFFILTGRFSLRLTATACLRSCTRSATPSSSKTDPAWLQNHPELLALRIWQAESLQKKQILPGPPTRPPDPLQQSRAVTRAWADLWEMSVWLIESDWFQSCSSVSPSLSSPSECYCLSTSSILSAYTAVGSKERPVGCATGGDRWIITVCE